MKIAKVIGLILLLGVLAFVGTCAYNVFKSDKQDGPKPPAASKAPYSLKITNTGVTLYASKVMVSGDKIGERKYLLSSGYWEANSKKYELKKLPLTLDERIFGEIKVKKR